MEEGISIAIGSAAVSSICTLAGMWLKARYSRTEIKPQPLKVEAATSYNAELCRERHRVLDGQVDKLFCGYNEVKALASTVGALDTRVASMDGKLDKIIANLGAQNKH